MEIVTEHFRCSNALDRKKTGISPVPIRCFLLLAVTFLSLFGANPVFPSDFTLKPGKHLKFDFINVEDGLLDKSIVCVAQDSVGFIWIATRYGGLYRYDGCELFRYLHDDKDSTSIGSNFVTDLLVDSEGYLWVTGQNDNFKRYSFIDRYDPNTHTFFHIVKSDSTIGTIFDFQEGAAGDYYFFSQKLKLYKITVRNNSYELQYQSQFKTTTDIPLPPKIKIEQILPIGDQKMILDISSIGIAEYDIQTGLADLNRFAKLNQYFTTQYIKPTIILIDRKGIFWIGTNSGLVYYNPNQKIIKHYLTQTKIENILKPGRFLRKNTNITGLSEDYDGNIWIVGIKSPVSEEFYKFDQESKTIYQYKTDPFQDNTISQVSINHIFIDRSRTVWLSTFQNGVYHFALPRPFKNINVLPDSVKLYKNEINDILEDRQGNLWMATETKLYRYNPSLKKANVFNFQIRNTNKYYIHNKNATQYRIYEDRQNIIWLGTSWGIQRYNRATDSFTHINLDSTLIKGSSGFINRKNQVRSFYEDQAGNFWIGTGDGLCLFDRHTEQYQYFRIVKDNPRKFLNKNCVFDIMDNGNGFLWLGTQDGFVKFDVKSKTSVNYHDSLAIQKYNNINSVGSLFESADGRIWLGSFSHDLISFDPNTDKFEYHSEAVGLHGKNVSSVTEDRHGKLWIRTVYGLVKYDPISHASVCYDRNDNVLYYIKDKNQSNFWDDLSVNDYCNRFSKSLCQTRSGWIYAGGINGITYFHPDSLIPDKPSNIVITKVNIQQRNQYTLNRPDEFRNIVLPWHDNFITISFALLDFYDVKDNRYKYILEGLEQEWIACGNTNQAAYLNVPPGQYTFRVVGENSDGIRSQNEASLNITIVPPFWRRLWFKLALITGTFTLIALVFQWRMATAHKQREKLKSLVLDRTQELSEKTFALETAHSQLEGKVLERTQELAAANAGLLHEMEIRRKAEESLRRSEEIARVLINAPVDLALLIDTQGLIIALNRSAARHFGAPSEQIINRNLIEILPSDVANYRYKYLVKCKESGQPQDFEDENHGRIFQNQFYPISGPDGNVLNIAVYARDITDQKKMEKFLRNARLELEILVDERTEELKQINRKLTREISTRKSIETKLRTSEGKYRDLFQNANDLIWIGDYNGKFLSINNHLKSFTGYSKKELLSLNPILLIQPEDRFRIIRRYRQVLKNQTTDIELNTVTKNGQVHPIWLKMRPIIKNNQIVGVHGIGRDISELRRAQNEIRESEEQKRESLRQFTLRLAHEIKNPLASIKSSAQLVAASDNAKNPQIDKHMGIINRNVDICNQVVQNLYSYTHLNGYQFEEKNTQSLIQKLNTFLNEKTTENQNLKITLKVDPDLPPLYIDEYHLSQAFRNIINNAIEAIPGKGKLDLAVRVNHTNKTITFECKDNGIGIPADDLPQIFQPFYSSKSKGFGLGLPFAKEIIENHHGTISVTSVLKRGTTFKVILPTL